MTGGTKRRYVPSEAYRYLVLAALAARRGSSASKGEIAWETRANHTMVTRVLRDLAAEGLVSAARREDGGFDLALTEAGRGYHERNAAALREVFRRSLADHFRYGRAPAWLGALADEG